MTTLWLLCVARWFPAQVSFIHNMFTILLVLRVVDDAMFFTLLALCPWTLYSPDYLEALLTSFETIYQSIFLAVVFSLSYVRCGIILGLLHGDQYLD